MRLYFAALLAAAISLFIAPPAFADISAQPLPAGAVKRVDLHNLQTYLPAIEGYVEIYGQDAEYDKVLESFVPPSNRLLAVYVSEQDIENMAKNAQEGMKRYMLIQTLRRDVRLRTQKDMDDFKRGFMQALGSEDVAESAAVTETINRGVKHINENYDSSFNMKVGEIRHMGPVAEQDDMFSVMVLGNYGVTTEAGGTVDMLTMMTMSNINIDGRLLFVYIYDSLAKTETELAALKNLTLSYIEKTRELNNVVSADAASEARVSLPAAVWFALGFLLMAVLAGGAFLLYQKRKPGGPA